MTQEEQEKFIEFMKKHHIPLQSNLFVDIWNWITTGGVGLLTTIIVYVVLFFIIFFNF